MSKLYIKLIVFVTICKKTFFELNEPNLSKNNNNNNNEK